MANLRAAVRACIVVAIIFFPGALVAGTLAVLFPAPGIVRFIKLWLLVPCGVVATPICAVGLFPTKAARISDRRPFLFWGGGAALWTLGLILEVIGYEFKHAATLLQAAGTVGILVWGVLTAIPRWPELREELKKQRSLPKWLARRKR